MAATKVLARDWTIQIGTGKDNTTFTTINGITSFSFTSSKTDADTTSFDEAGRESHIVSKRGNGLTVEGKYLEDSATKTRDSGQAAVEELAEKIGPDSIGTFKLTSPGGTIRTFKGSVKMADIGGGTDDPTSWGFEVTVSGTITKTTA